MVASKLLGELMTALRVKRGMRGGRKKANHNTQMKKDLSSRETRWLEGSSMGKTVVLDQFVDS